MNNIWALLAGLMGKRGRRTASYMQPVKTEVPYMEPNPPPYVEANPAGSVPYMEPVKQKYMQPQPPGQPSYMQPSPWKGMK